MHWVNALLHKEVAILRHLPAQVHCLLLHDCVVPISVSTHLFTNSESNEHVV